MWQPDPGWQPLPGGRSGALVYAATVQDRPAVVKRFAAPQPGDPAELRDPAHVGWWRREADVALAGELGSTAGIRAPETLDVQEDESGITLIRADVAAAEQTGPHAARMLGVFASNDLVPEFWWATQVLGNRLDRLVDRGGWPTLARTTLADVADRLWQRRGHWLSALSDLPQVPQHGDPTLANLRGVDDTDDQRAVAIDWGVFGSGPLGADVGYLALSVREDLPVLVDAYVAGHGRCHPEGALLGARVMAVYTALTRTEWALARVAAGPGALAGKYRHPSVAPYIHALQRLFPQLEELL